MSKEEEEKWGVAKYYLKPILALFEDASISEIMINDYKTVFVKRNGEMESVDIQFESDNTVTTAIEQVCNVVGGGDANALTNPIIEAALWDGSRFTGVLGPVSQKGSSITIRVFRDIFYTVDDLVSFGSLTVEMRDFFQ